MDFLKLKIITPRRVVIEEEIKSITAPSFDGEITILPHHTNLFSLLQEGIIKIIKKNGEEDYLAVGGGYIETDGEEVIVLVSRAYKQDEVDEEKIKEAVFEAKKLLSEAKDESQRQQALATLRRSIIESKLLKRKKKKITISS